MGEQRTRILVVDDERFFREAIQEILEEAGFDCVLAESGERALELAADPSLGVVVLDIRLPGIDGIDVLRQLRETRPALREIMLSASTDQELVLEALRIGACDYLAKPLHDEELVLAVRRAADGYGVESEWSTLRAGLERLVGRMELLAQESRTTSTQEERAAILRQAAADAVSVVLDAGKTSVMLLNADQTTLEVAATSGRDIDPLEMDPVPVGSGVAGFALGLAEPIVVGDVRGDQRFAAHAQHGERYESDSFAVVPLRSGDTEFGVLCATDRAGGGVFGEEDLALLRLLAMQLSEFFVREDREEAAADAKTATLGAAAEEEEDAADDDAELARLVCDAIVAEVEPDRVLSGALAHLPDRLAAAPTSLYLVDSRADALVCEVQNDGGRREDRPTLPLRRGLTGAVLLTGQLVASPDPAADPRFDPEVDTPADGVAAPLLCVPLLLRGKIIGVFRAFSAAAGTPSARTGEVLGAALSAAVRNALLYRSLVETIEEVAEARREARS